MSSDRAFLRLQDIVDNIDRNKSHLGDMTYEEFAHDAKTVDAIERCLQRITEAAIKIGPERMALVSPRTPAEAVRGLGNLLRHAYDEIDLATIWATVKDCLPDLRRDCVVALHRDD